MASIRAEKLVKRYGAVQAVHGIDFEIAGNRVTGTYPKFQGRLSGTVIERGVVTGIWTQPRSQQPCDTQRNGTNAWGTFIITNWGAPTMRGSWGYCGDKPDFDIGFQ